MTKIGRIHDCSLLLELSVRYRLAKDSKALSDDLKRLCDAIWQQSEQAQIALQALTDPFLAVGMLYQTMVKGFRGNPNHLRPLDTNGDCLADDLQAMFKLHLRIMSSLWDYTDLSQGGVEVAALEGDGGWCDLCGQCCCHCGTVPTSLPDHKYPAWWYHAIAGEKVQYQPYCPFLFQAADAQAYYCAIHLIKPIACRRFDRQDCERGRASRGFLID